MSVRSKDSNKKSSSSSSYSSLSVSLVWKQRIIFANGIVRMAIVRVEETMPSIEESVYDDDIVE